MAGPLLSVPLPCHPLPWPECLIAVVSLQLEQSQCGKSHSGQALVPPQPERTWPEWLGPHHLWLSHLAEKETSILSDG